MSDIVRLNINTVVGEIKLVGICTFVFAEAFRRTVRRRLKMDKLLENHQFATHAIAASASVSLGTALAYPLDTIKTIIQVSSFIFFFSKFFFYFLLL